VVSKRDVKLRKSIRLLSGFPGRMAYASEMSCVCDEERRVANTGSNNKIFSGRELIVICSYIFAQYFVSVPVS